MKKLIKRNYNSIVNRGLITSDTTDLDFLNKLQEEVTEAFESELGTKEHALEVADCILVCMNYLYHTGIHIPGLLKHKIKINEDRAAQNK